MSTTAKEVAAELKKHPGMMVLMPIGYEGGYQPVYTELIELDHFVFVEDPNGERPGCYYPTSGYARGKEGVPA